jgi:hypothetical protein
MKTVDWKQNTFEWEDGQSRVQKRMEDKSNEEEEIVSHPPRLFVIREDETGYELLGEQEAAKYIKAREEEAKIKAETFMTIEPVAGDDSSVSFTFLRKLLKNQRNNNENKNSKDEILIYRQLIKHAALSEESLDLLVEEQEKYADWKKERNRRKDKEASIHLPEPPSEEELKKLQEKIDSYQKLKEELNLQKREQQVISRYSKTKEDQEKINNPIQVEQQKTPTETPKVNNHIFFESLMKLFAAEETKETLKATTC